MNRSRTSCSANTNRHTIGAVKLNGSSSIPLRKQLSRQSSNSSTTSRVTISDPAHRWKQKYEESEEKRKKLLTEKEKALRSLNDLEKKNLNLQVKHEHLETELFEKNEEFTKLSTASKNLYKEYETLKNQYETETGAMARALKDASQWYKENKELKRKTLFLSDKDAVDEGVDTGESAGDADIENLNKTIKHLSTEVAELQTELDSVKQSEFQALENNLKLNEELEATKKENKSLKVELDELKNERDQLLRLSDVLKKEVEKLREIDQQQRESIDSLKKEAEDCRKERNVLAHQSTLLLHGLCDDDEGANNLFLLQEIETLKRTLEEERNKYDEEIAGLQERLEDSETNSHVEVLEERLKIVEAELQGAIARAEAAEEKAKAVPLAPPPPPPPPPPQFTPADQPPVVPLRRRKSRATVQELAQSIGVEDSGQEKKVVAAPGVNDDIINAIKEGKFTLKKAKKESNKDKEAPKAVSELLNILGSLRRAPKKRQSQYLGDVQL
ncbi:shootin-1-like isoform X2 [Cylas formicarius]|nr:shootin-1-like isoform X2 [Cylas formicarius]XP_060528198.1 shootin-1-like isoform X2 [Cylas formicarius]